MNKRIWNYPHHATLYDLSILRDECCDSSHLLHFEMFAWRVSIVFSIRMLVMTLPEFLRFISNVRRPVSVLANHPIASLAGIPRQHGAP